MAEYLLCNAEYLLCTENGEGGGGYGLLQLRSAKSNFLVATPHGDWSIFDDDESDLIDIFEYALNCFLELRK